MQKLTAMRAAALPMLSVLEWIPNVFKGTFATWAFVEHRSFRGPTATILLPVRSFLIRRMKGIEL